MTETTPGTRRVERRGQLRIGLRADVSAQLDGAVLDGDRHLLGRDPERPQDDVLADLGGDLVVGAHERPDEVGARDDPDQHPVVGHDREPVDALVDHPPRGLGDRPGRRDRDGGRRHRLPGRQGAQLLAHVDALREEQPGKTVPRRIDRTLLDEDVRLRHDADDPFAVDDRQPRDPVLRQRPRHVLQ